MFRRIIAIEKNATFTSNAAEVDVANKKFPADPLMEDRIESEDAVWCYLRKLLFPWVRLNTAE